MENLRTVTMATDSMTLEERMIRIDTLLCILFGGLTSHPLANTLIPPAELEQLKALLPQSVTIEG